MCLSFLKFLPRRIWMFPVEKLTKIVHFPVKCFFFSFFYVLQNVSISRKRQGLVTLLRRLKLLGLSFHQSAVSNSKYHSQENGNIIPISLLSVWPSTDLKSHSIESILLEAQHNWLEFQAIKTSQIPLSKTTTPPHYNHSAPQDSHDGFPSWALSDRWGGFSTVTLRLISHRVKLLCVNWNICAVKYSNSPH